MSSTEEPSEEADPSVLGAKLKRLANLAPPWQPGQSGNPSGLTKDGFPSKNNRIREDVQQMMAQPIHRRRFIKAWFEDACNGDAKAREQILQRLDPVNTDDGRQGVVVFEGIKLELVARTSAQAPEAPRDVTIETAHPSSDSFALPESSESQGGNADQGISTGESASDSSESQPSKD